MLSLWALVLSLRLQYLKAKAKEKSANIRLCGCSSACDEHLYQIQEPSARAEEPSARVEEPSAQVEEPSAQEKAPSAWGQKPLAREKEVSVPSAQSNPPQT